MKDGRPPVAVLGVDGGNSKADLALVTADGSLLAAIRGPTVSHQAAGGMPAAVRSFQKTLAAALALVPVDVPADGRPIAQVAVLSVAGADSKRHVHRLMTAFGRLGIAERLIVVSDAYGALRAGTDDGIGAVVICGSGSNMLAISPTGRIARYPALGETAGDWGGGGTLGPAALAAAVRGRDGRGPRTSLERRVPEHFGLHDPLQVTEAVDRGRIRLADLRDLAPVLFAAAADGDAVARELVDRQADEIVAMAVAALRTARLLRSAVPVVLAGGIFRTEDRAFYDRITTGLAARAPHAEIRRLSGPPVIGALLLGLDALAEGSAAERAEAAARVRGLVDGAVRPVGSGQ